MRQWKLGMEGIRSVNPGKIPDKTPIGFDQKLGKNFRIGDQGFNQQGDAVVGKEA